MYILTSKELEPAQMRYGTFAGTLGQASLPIKMQSILDQVRKRPQDFQNLLLSVRFDPAPGTSRNKHLSELHKLAYSSKVPDPDAVFLKAVGDLEQILDKSLQTNRKLKRQVEIEAKLRDQLMKAIGDLGPQKLEPFLLRALVPDIFTYSYRKEGLRLAKEMLPKPLYKRIVESPITNAHFNMLGTYLRRYAEVRQSRDPAFNRRVQALRKQVQGRP
jgi:hypothetical protein